MDNLFHLAWSSHNSTIIHNIQRLQDKESFCDVTVVCDRKHFPLHKLVLSSCSEYFEEIFEDTPCKHPFIVLKDIKVDTFKDLMEFMYKGEVNMSHERLPIFINAANSLKIKGISIPDELKATKANNTLNSAEKKRELICSSSLQPAKKTKISKQKHKGASVETQKYNEKHTTNRGDNSSENPLRDVEKAQENHVLNISKNAKTKNNIGCDVPQSTGTSTSSPFKVDDLIGKQANILLPGHETVIVKEELDLLTFVDCGSLPSTSEELFNSAEYDEDQLHDYDASKVSEDARSRSPDQLAIDEVTKFEEELFSGSDLHHDLSSFEDNGDAAQASTSDPRTDTSWAPPTAKPNLVPEFCRYVQPYLRGEVTDLDDISGMRSQIINQLIHHLNVNRLLLSSSRALQAWGYRKLANQLLVKYPNIIREKSTRRRVAKGELAMIVMRVADRRRKLKLKQRTGLAHAFFESPQAALSFLESKTSKRPTGERLLQAIKFSKHLRDMIPYSSLPIYLQTSSAITLEVELMFKMKLTMMASLIASRLPDLDQFGVSTVRSLVDFLSEPEGDRVLSENVLLPPNLSGFIGPCCVMNNLDASSGCHIYYTDKQFFEFKYLSPVKALILTLGLYFILRIKYPSAYAQVLGLFQSFLTPLPFDKTRSSVKLKAILESLER